MSWNKHQRERGVTLSERSASIGSEILRSAQDDRTALGRYHSQSAVAAINQALRRLRRPSWDSMFNLFSSIIGLTGKAGEGYPLPCW